jgi:hypothetical protein
MKLCARVHAGDPCPPNKTLALGAAALRAASPSATSPASTVHRTLSQANGDQLGGKCAAERAPRCAWVAIPMERCSSSSAD